jgi:hypothetical protein
MPKERGKSLENDERKDRINYKTKQLYSIKVERKTPNTLCLCDPLRRGVWISRESIPMVIR